MKLRSRTTLICSLLAGLLLGGCQAAPGDDGGTPDAGKALDAGAPVDAGGDDDAGTPPPPPDGGPEDCPVFNPVVNPVGQTCRTEGLRCGPEDCLAPGPGACTFIVCHDGTWQYETQAPDDAGTVVDAGTSDAGTSDDAGTFDAGAADAGDFT